MDSTGSAEGDFSTSVDEAIARNIKKARERSGYSQAEIAKLLTEAGVPGIHQTTIARIESGERTVRLAEALVIARILDYRVEDLVESSESAKLRDMLDGLQKDVERMKAASQQLLYTRHELSKELDRKFPWHPDGASVTAEYIKVNPVRYDLLDELLALNSSPDVVIRHEYENLRRSLIAHVKHPTPFVDSRSMELLEEAMEYSWSAPTVRDLSEESDAEFQAMLAHFDEVPQT